MWGAPAKRLTGCIAFGIEWKKHSWNPHLKKSCILYTILIINETEHVDFVVDFFSVFGIFLNVKYNIYVYTHNVVLYVFKYAALFMLFSVFDWSFHRKSAALFMCCVCFFLLLAEELSFFMDTNIIK
jgi:hypothetical protein